MEKKKTILRPTKERKTTKLFNGKNRYLVMFLMIIPFLIAMGVFGFIAYKEVKNIKDFASGNTAVTKDENVIKSMDFVLRDNATDLQKEYFAELKKAIEGPYEEGESFNDVTVAGLIAKNYVADFYTWTNKQGQFDIGGMNYVFDGRYENNDHFRENVFLAARDGFYKYLSAYITEHGVENLIEVENVEITKCEKAPWKFLLNEHVSYKQDDEGEWYDYREDSHFDSYLVTCKWTYKEGSKLDIGKFPTSINLLVIDNDGVFQIIEASESEIKERVKAEVEDAESVEENKDTD